MLPSGSGETRPFKKARCHKQPSRPQWKPLYAAHSVRVESWSKFVSEAYWSVELK